MTDAISVNDFLKNAPVAASNSGLSVICADSSGNLLQHPLKTNLDAVNIDTLTTQGVYRLNAGTLGTLPDPSWQYGIVEVFQRYSMVIQRITLISGEMATRGCNSYTNPDWRNWKVYSYT